MTLERGAVYDRCWRRHSLCAVASSERAGVTVCRGWGRGCWLGSIYRARRVGWGGRSIQRDEGEEPDGSEPVGVLVEFDNPTKEGEFEEGLFGFVSAGDDPEGDDPGGDEPGGEDFDGEEPDGEEPDGDEESGDKLV